MHNIDRGSLDDIDRDHLMCNIDRGSLDDIDRGSLDASEFTDDI